MDQWDLDYVDLEESGHITFEKGGSGSLHFGCVDAGLDWRLDETVERLEFTFDGADEGTPVTGRGWAKAEGKRLVGHIVFHLGDESGFKATKAK